MNKQLVISIPEPCQENWNLMTPLEQGRFCSNCKKNVVDFTTKNDEEILNFFNNYNGNTCGRFSNEQLDRPFEVIEIKPSSPFIKYAASLLLPMIMVSNKLIAQKKVVKELKEIVINGYVKKVGKVSAYYPVAGPVKIKEKDTFHIKPLTPSSFDQLTKVTIGGVSAINSDKFYFDFKGIIIDKFEGNPLAGVNVIIRGEKYGTTTNEKGEFELRVKNKNSILEFTSIGFIKSELSLNSIKLEEKNIIKLLPVVMGLGEVIVTGNNFKKHNGILGGAISRIIIQKRTIWEQIKDTLSPAKVKIYPNPVSRSGTINLMITDVKSGKYQIRLINSAGQLFYSFEKQISSKADLEQIHLNDKMISGIYFIQLIDNKRKLIQSSKIVLE
jgi:hypothetical protein